MGFFLLSLMVRRQILSVCSVKEGLSEKQSESLTVTIGKAAVCEIGFGGNGKTQVFVMFLLAQFECVPLCIDGKRKLFLLNLCCKFGNKAGEFSDVTKYKFWNFLHIPLSLTKVNLQSILLHAAF